MWRAILRRKAFKNTAVTEQGQADTSEVQEQYPEKTGRTDAPVVSPQCEAISG